MKEMVAVICKCAKHNKLFGIRFDQINSRTWEYAWAFPLKDGADRREQGFSTTMRGTFVEGVNYPGCPLIHRLRLAPKRQRKSLIYIEKSIKRGSESNGSKPLFFIQDLNLRPLPPQLTWVCPLVRFACFHAVSAPGHLLPEHFSSAVSACSVFVCGKNCGQTAF